MKVYPKLVATDLDGTIVQHGRIITDRTVAALKLAASRGAKVVYATGRSLSDLNDVGKVLDKSTIPLAICCNGAMIYDFIKKDYTQLLPINLVAARSIITCLKQSLPEAVFAAQSLQDFYAEPNFTTKFSHKEDSIKLSTIEEILDIDLYKICIQANYNGYTAQSLIEQVQPLLLDSAQVCYAHLDAPSLEIASFGVSKGSAVAKISEDLGLHPEEVVVFGDGGNDLTMLEFTPNSYAPQSASPRAKLAAKNSAPSCNEDGVAQILEELFA